MTQDSSRGFTVIELVVAMAIMAILAAIAAPNFQEFMTQRRLSGAARVIASDLMNARMQAVSQNNWVLVSLANDHQYQIARDVNKNLTVDTGEGGPSKDIHPDYYDVTFASSSSGYNPVFYGNGTALNGKITVSNSRGDQLYIKISTGGRIKIDENS
ncbi:type IV fimbrial biogenesis protein FimT [Syntrophus gentianae]|uniref:Type II secretion system protein H n=1 Tax=Syntrophus gentianae TaxID=43775 RepID=A0A1H7Z430_9BACT|nr:GspH/FimT family protein [Syntrophus gentianae]SEM52973.1 type IV fimbrial biogenesis protein FimT [Syntrophus gentianae]